MASASPDARFRVGFSATPLALLLAALHQLSLGASPKDVIDHPQIDRPWGREGHAATVTDGFGRAKTVAIATAAVSKKAVRRSY